MTELRISNERIAGNQPSIDERDLMAALRDALVIARTRLEIAHIEHDAAIIRHVLGETNAVAEAYRQRMRTEAFKEAAVIARTAPTKATGHQWTADQAEWIAEQIRARAAAETK